MLLAIIALRVVMTLIETGLVLRVLIVGALHVVLHILTNGGAALRLVRQDTRQLPAVSGLHPVRVHLGWILPRAQRLSILLVADATHTWRVILTGLHDLMLGGSRPILAE